MSNIQGSTELNAVLKSLETNGIARVAKSVVGAGATVIRRNIAKMAPVGETGSVKKSIGRRVIKDRVSGLVSAKIGVNVGKRTKLKGRHAPHAHMVAAGTRPRFRKRIGGRFAFIKNPTTSQLRTESTPANPFVAAGFSAGQAGAVAAMKKQFAKSLEREALRAAR